MRQWQHRGTVVDRIRHDKNLQHRPVAVDGRGVKRRRRIPTLLVGGDLSVEVLVAGASRLDVVARAPTLPRATAMLAEHPVEMVVLHMTSTGRQERELLETLDYAKPRPHILVLHESKHGLEISKAWRAGADNVLVAPYGPSALAEGIQYALRQVVRDPDDPVPPMTRRYADQYANDRARAILKARFDGDSNAEIAEALGISEVAVKRALKRAFFEPLGASNVLDLERCAIEFFDLDDDDD